MMPIVNGRFLKRQVTGVERYGRAMLQALDNRFQVVSPDGPSAGWHGHAWEQFILPGRVRPGDVLWSPANSGPLGVANQVLTLHDLTPLEHPEWFKPAFSHWYGLFLPLLVRRVRRIIVNSEYVRKKVLARFSLPAEKVVCIPAGVDQHQFHPTTEPKKPYVLFVGTLERRKNLGGLLQAWRLVSARYPDHMLLVAGGPGKVFRSIDLDTGGEKNVHLVGRVTDANLPGLYAGAELFILPSFDEGFGLTALESMACGTPVIAARAGALPEVIGGAGLYFNPSDPIGMAKVLDGCLSDPELREKMRQKGLERSAQFSWRTSAEKTLQVLQECL